MLNAAPDRTIRPPGPPRSPVEVRVLDGPELDAALDRLGAYYEETAGRSGPAALGRHPGWLAVLAKGLRHRPYCVEALDAESGATRGILPLAFVKSLLFGRFLVGLPYLNTGGVVADDAEAANALVGRAAALAEALGVRHLELRHERAVEHEALGRRVEAKVHMRLPLPGTVEELRRGLPSKVRNQVVKGERGGLDVDWGGAELLPEFLDVFSENMRDLGTPPYGRRLFAAILQQFPGRSELCVVRLGREAVAASLLLHGRGIAEVPSASSLRRHNATNANMLMYWKLLERAVGRGHDAFDFGRSSLDSNTYRFKKQWGAIPEPACWQYAELGGSAGDVRPDNPKYEQMIRAWRRLPVWAARLIGPAIVRGIP